jgi:hypothetical protein
MYKVVEVFTIVELKIHHVFGRDSRHISSGRYELNGGLKSLWHFRTPRNICGEERTNTGFASPGSSCVGLTLSRLLHQEVCAVHYIRCMKAFVTFQPRHLMRMYRAYICVLFLLSMARPKRGMSLDRF